MAVFMLSDVYYNQMVDARSALGNVGNTVVEQGEVGKQHHNNPKAPLLSKLPPEVLAPLAGVRKPYLTSTFAAIEARSGSVIDYIQQELDVSDEEVAAIRKNFLTGVQ